MFDIEYSIMYHRPSLVAIDRITLAIIFFNKQTKDVHFIQTKNWRRVASFNDELNVDLIKLQLDGIDDEIHEIAKHSTFELEKYTKFFVNDLKFTKIISTSAQDFDQFIDECTRLYMPQDYEKSKRPSTQEQLNFIKNHLKQYSVDYNINKIQGDFSENVNFDFIIKNYAFKLFKFKDKSESRLVSCVKEWAYTTNELKDKYNIVFITDKDSVSEEEYKKLYSILSKECCKILSFDEIIEFIQSI